MHYITTPLHKLIALNITSRGQEMRLQPSVNN
jgi:hypothetical protein